MKYLFRYVAASPPAEATPPTQYVVTLQAEWGYIQRHTMIVYGTASTSGRERAYFCAIAEFFLSTVGSIALTLGKPMNRTTNRLEHTGGFKGRGSKGAMPPKMPEVTSKCEKSSASGRLRPPDPYRGSAPEPRWGTP